MIKKLFTIGIIILLATGLAACGGKQAAQTGADIPFATDSVESTEKNDNTPVTSAQPSNNLINSSDSFTEQSAGTKESIPDVAEKTDNSILIAYFSRVGNTDFSDGVDAITSASLVMKDDEVFGNTQYIANLIQRNTDGEMFSIQVSDKYPADYEATVDRAEQENRNEDRPELDSHVNHIEDYDIIFLGFPNWWYDMPMAIYSFLDKYDLSGKTIVPFCTSGGSAFSNSIEEIQSLEPDATVLPNGFAVTHSKIENCTSEDINEWIQGLSLQIQK